MNPSNDRRRLLAMLGALPLGTVLTSPARAQASAPLTFGFQNTSWGTVGMVAEAEKTFQKAGANVSVFKFDSGKAVRDAMIAGRIDIGVLGTTPMIVGAAKGEVQPLAMAMYAGKTNALVVAKNSGIKSVADLKGKKIASQLGSATDHVFQTKILPKFGLAKGDVTTVNSKFENHIAALTGKSVDAFAGVEPFPSVAETEGLGLVLLDYTEYDMVPVWLGINRPVLEQKADAVTAFLRGWLAAVKIFKDTPDRAAKIVWEHFKGQGYSISEPAIRRMLAKFDVNPLYVPALRNYLYDESKLLLAQKQIPAVPDWDKVLDAGYLQRAMKV